MQLSKFCFCQFFRHDNLAHFTVYIVRNWTQIKRWTVENLWSIFRCWQTTVVFGSERLVIILQYGNYWCIWHAWDTSIWWSTKVAVGLEWMWWESVIMCYWMPLKGGTQKQWNSNKAAVTGKEAKSTIVTHGTIRVNNSNFTFQLQKELL